MSACQVPRHYVGQWSSEVRHGRTQALVPLLREHDRASKAHHLARLNRSVDDRPSYVSPHWFVPIVLQVMPARFSMLRTVDDETPNL